MKTFADAQKVVEDFIEEHTQRSFAYKHTYVDSALKDLLRRLRLRAAVIEPGVEPGEHADVEQP